MDLLKEPVICILDGITYEKSAISKWLEDHRNTPSRISMQQGQKVADILIPNRAIITAVEEYESLVSPNI